MTTGIPNELARRAEEARDLKKQLAELQSYDEQEIIFRETSPARKIIPLYSMEDGSTVMCLQYRLESWLAKLQDNGQARFTADPKKAPPLQKGKHRCFMAVDSPEREILNEIGIFKTCAASHLANAFAASQHAQHKHQAEWKAYQEEVFAAERREERAERQAQTAATLELARAAAGTRKAAS